MADRSNDIVKEIARISGRYSAYEIFSDWVSLMALAIQNACYPHKDKIYTAREEQYKQLMTKYNKAEQESMISMFGMLTETLEHTITDVLGYVFMASKMGSAALGQFFTPFQLAELCARVGYDYNYRPEQGKLTINEPSCGGGANVIAALKVMGEQGLNYQRYTDIVCQDLDWKCVYMCYVQLSLLGASAIVVQGDTLANPYVEGTTKEENIFRTPKKMGVLL